LITTGGVERVHLRLGRVATVAALIVAALPLAARASTYNRWCGTSRDGFLLGPKDSNYETPYEVSGPWHIKTTALEAAKLASEQPPGEFGTHITQTDMPCILANSIATSASKSWLHWTTDSGQTNVSTNTYGGTTHIGDFNCIGQPLQPPKVVKETCTYHHGLIVGAFTVSDNPYYP